MKFFVKKKIDRFGFRILIFFSFLVLIVFKMSTRSQTNHRRLARLPALQSKTLNWWMHSLNISDVSTLHQVSATWNELASANYPYYNSIDIHSSNFANPSLFDDAALLRVVKMSGKYLKSLRLSGLHSLVLERRSPLGLHLKGNGSNIVLISITNCKGININNQIGRAGWIDSLPKLNTLNLNECGNIDLRDLTKLKKQLSQTISLDLQECEKKNCKNIFGGDTTCYCLNDTTDRSANFYLYPADVQAETESDDERDDAHVQKIERFGNKKLCSSCMHTHQCLNCDVYFCEANDTAVKCSECNVYLCTTCDTERHERVQQGKQKKNDWRCFGEWYWYCGNCPPSETICNYPDCGNCSMLECSKCALRFCADECCESDMIKCVACTGIFCSVCLPNTGSDGERYWCCYCEDHMCVGCMEDGEMTFCSGDGCHHGSNLFCTTEAKNCRPHPEIEWLCKVCDNEIEVCCGLYCAGDSCFQCIRCKQLTCETCFSLSSHYWGGDCRKPGHGGNGMSYNNWQLCEACGNERSEEEIGCPTCTGFSSGHSH